MPFNEVKKIFSKITSNTINNSKSFELFGDSNQGHFVKMVHNGIEYVEMQLISSIYYFMIKSNKYKYDDIAKVFKKWSKSDLNSYLLEISSTKLLEKTDGNFLYKLITRVYIPIIAFIFSGKTKAYLYLIDSTKNFPPRKKFLEILKKIGFNKVETRKKLYGASTIYIASK